MTTENKAGKTTRRIAPLPNVLKIEVLTAEELKSYSSIIGDISFSLREKIRNYQSISRDNLNTFYSFLQGGDLEFKIVNEYENGSVGLISKALGEVSKANKSVSTVGSLIKSGVTDLAGIDFTSFGASSRKTYKGSTISTADSVTCGWYLPQSLAQARIGIKTLMDIVYPSPFDFDRLRNDVGIDTTAGTNIININDRVSTLIDAIDNKDAANENTQKQTTNTSPLLSTVDDLVNLIPKVVAEAKDAFGASVNLEPLPVRVYIGTKMILEPMVIKSVTIKMSKESFYANVKNSEPYYSRSNSDSSTILLPEFVHITIGFDYWLQPGQDKNRLSMLGMNIFTKEIGTVNDGIVSSTTWKRNLYEDLSKEKYFDSIN